MSWRDQPWCRWQLVANLTLLFAAAVWCRAGMLDHVPGLNGDEAWQGVQAQNWLQGEDISWRTPTGNPINPLMFFPLVALHAWLPPSIVLLRLMPLASGLLALAVNYVLCRRLFSARLAIISTVILAVLPVTIAYSRFAWDASQTVLVTLPVIYCSLGAMRELKHRRRWILGSVAALVLASIVHPTNVFLAPIVIVAAAWSWPETLAGWRRRFRCTRATCLALTGSILTGLILVVGVRGWVATRCANPELQSQVFSAAERLVSPRQAGVFAQRCVDLLSGTTVFRYLAASQLESADPATLAYRLAAWAVVLWAGYGVWREVQRRTQKDLTVLLIGLGCSLGAFYVVAGPAAIQPHFERYGMWMVAPCCLVLATGVAWWTERQHSVVHVRPAVAVMIAWGMLAGFGWYYFRPLLSENQGLHVAFRTANVEPKQAALKWIQAQQSRQPPQPIVASGWWLYWPLKYLAGDDPRLIVLPEDVPTVSVKYPGRGATWRVTWCDESALHCGTIRDVTGRPLVRIVPPVREIQNAPTANLP